jgi:hypothetical protein
MQRTNTRVRASSLLLFVNNGIEPALAKIGGVYAVHFRLGQHTRLHMRSLATASRLVGILILTFGAHTCLAQQPSFGRPGLWERTSESKNTRLDGKPEPPFKHTEKGCSDNAQLEGVADPIFKDINRADQTCSYTDIKASSNTVSWSYQCSESPKRTGRSRGQVHHQYDPRTDTVVQRHSFSLDFVRSKIDSDVRWSNTTGEAVITAKRLGDCQRPSPTLPRVTPSPAPQ